MYVSFQATKQGTSLTSYATIVVHIEDVNEPPFFLNTHYIAWVSEHTNIGEPVHAFISAVDDDEVSIHKFLSANNLSYVILCQIRDRMD